MTRRRYAIGIACNDLIDLPVALSISVASEGFTFLSVGVSGNEKRFSTFHQKYWIHHCQSAQNDTDRDVTKMYSGDDDSKKSAEKGNRRQKFRFQ